MRRLLRRAVVAMGLLGALLALTAGTAQAAPPQEAEGIGVLESCFPNGCGTVHNWTDRGFHVTLNWGAPWNDENVKWVAPGSSLGAPQNTDVDGVYVGSGCRMRGSRTGLLPQVINWGPGWHQIHNFETATILSHVC
jgi:hypothetical protein